MFHRHNFEIIAKTFSGKYSLKSCSEYLAERMIFGVTTVLLKCSICGKVIKEEMLGDSTDAKQ